VENAQRLSQSSAWTAAEIAVAQRVEAAFEVIPFEGSSGRAYGLVYAAVQAGVRSARGSRAIDLLIAATVLANGLPLYTRNPDDFSGLEDLVEVVTP
jgi:hypothetical protein